MNKTVALTLCTLILGGAVVGAAFTMSRFMLKIQQTSEKSITVKGVAEENIVSDVGAFSCTIKCKAPTIADGYRELNRLTGILNSVMSAMQITQNEIEDITINYSAEYKDVKLRDSTGKDYWERHFSHYNFSRSCRVRSQDVQKIANAAIKLYALTAQNIVISVSSPEYFISNPEQYKLKLIDLATSSAYARAKTVATNSNAELGPLLNARQGVIQITRPASSDSSDGGTYDTSSINKVMRMVVTLEYTLK